MLFRSEKRERPVGRAIIERQYQTFELSKDLIRQEEFDQVVEFEGGDSEKVQIEILFRPVQRPQRADAGPSRRPERPRQPFERRTGGNGAPVSSPPKASVASPVQPTVDPRPVAPAPSNNVATAKPAQTPTPVAGTPPALGAQTAGAPPNVSKKDF